MNGDMFSIIIVRQRGQLTIPKKLREKASWLSEGSMVAILSSLDKEIKIKPYQEVEEKRTVNWKEVWEKIKVSRTFEGKRGNLSRFIAEDRSLH